MNINCFKVNLMPDSRIKFTTSKWWWEFGGDLAQIQEIMVSSKPAKQLQEKYTEHSKLKAKNFKKEQPEICCGIVVECSIRKRKVTGSVLVSTEETPTISRLVMRVKFFESQMSSLWCGQVGEKNSVHHQFKIDRLVLLSL